LRFESSRGIQDISRNQRIKGSLAKPDADLRAPRHMAPEPGMGAPYGTNPIIGVLLVGSPINRRMI
jgi:hypothetical protein